MKSPGFSELTDVLRYLGEIGYRDLYRRLPATPTVDGASAEAVALPAEEASGPALSLEELAAKASVCQRCRLAETRQSVVFGSGPPNADLMLIGEAPGAEEDRRGLPFVGAAGELLTRMIKAIELQREDVYIANIVKCRPPGNRDPLPDEVASCREYLDGQIAQVRPRVLVGLGRVAAQVLLENDLPIGRQRGQWFRYQGADLLVTYHPAALLRNQALRRPTWEDLQKVRDRLRELADAPAAP